MFMADDPHEAASVVQAWMCSLLGIQAVLAYSRSVMVLAAACMAGVQSRVPVRSRDPPVGGKQMKPFWQSKTLWLNIVTLGLHYAKPFLGIDTVPDVDPQLVMIANIVLRLVTKSAVTLKP